MVDPEEITPAHREFEVVMKTLRPAATGSSPISAAFNAGHRSARRSIRIWQSATFAALMLGVGIYWFPNHPGSVQPTGEPVGPLAISGPSLPSAPLDNQSLIMLQQAFRERGVDGLPAVHLPQRPRQSTR